MKTLDELRETPTHIVCEHGASQRSCDACECLALEAEIGELKDSIKGLKEDVWFEFDKRVRCEIRMDEACDRLTTLEAAVRAVRETENGDWGRRLADLYALVPEVK